MTLFKDLKEKASSIVASATRDAEVKKWLDALIEAEKREHGWRKKAGEVVKLYEQASEGAMDAANLVDYNILYANTETLSPAVFNNTPRPIVKRRVGKEDPVAMAAAHVLKSTLAYLSDTGDYKKGQFDEMQRSAVMEALTAGRGMSRFDYDGEIDTAPAEGANPAVERVSYECVEGEAVPWNRFLHGYAKQWHKVPWAAFEHFMTKEECDKNFPGVNIKLTRQAKEDDDADKTNKLPENAQGVKFAHIWEIWDKDTKTVFYVSEGHDHVFKRAEDPFKLSGFFNFPKPLMFIQRVSSLTPQTLYQMYQRQAEELEKATRRIDNMLDMLKVRGFYDGTLEGLDELLKKDNGTLMPQPNAVAMQQGGSLDKAIWIFPVEKVITVLQQLYLARVQIINTIHQLTGIADIMRGASQASETLGAQKMKESWGTMRLKRMQKEVARYTRECFRIQAELAALHFSIDTFKEMTAIQLPMAADKQQAQMVLQQFQMQQAVAQQAPQQPGMPPAQPAQPTPEVQQAQATLQKPAWEEVLGFLRQDPIRNYVIDIETNSTVDLEATEDKAELAEMMNAMSQLMNGTMPMVKEGVLPFAAAKALTLSVISKFRLGDEVEEVFRAMQEPPKQEDPAAQKVKAEMAAAKEEHGLEMQSRQAEIANRQREMDMEFQHKERLLQLELQVAREKLQIERESLELKAQAAEQKHEQQMEATVMKAVMPPAAPTPAPGQGDTKGVGD